VASLLLRFSVPSSVTPGRICLVLLGPVKGFLPPSYTADNPRHPQIDIAQDQHKTDDGNFDLACRYDRSRMKSFSVRTFCEDGGYESEADTRRSCLGSYVGIEQQGIEMKDQMVFVDW
jgi:hypothetical protein